MSDEVEKKFIKRSDPYTYNIVLELCRKYINSDDIVLDVGCGSGYIIYKLSSITSNVFGCDIDINQYQDEDTKKNIKQVDLDSQNLPYEDQSFDAAIFLDVAEHLFNPYKIIKEIFRILKKEGILIMSTPNVHNWINRVYFGLVGKFKGFWDEKDRMELGQRHLTPIFKHALENFLKHQVKGYILEEKFNRSIIPIIRIEVPIRNIFLSETIIWAIKKI